MANGLNAVLNSAFNGIPEPQNVIQNIPQGYPIPSAPNSQTVNFEKLNAMTVITGRNTLWYADFSQKASTFSGNTGKQYMARIVLEKSDPSLPEIFSAIDEAINEGKRRFGDIFCGNFTSPVHDGDTNCPKNANAQNYKGKYYIYARSYILPIVANANGKLLQDNTKTYEQLPLSWCEGPSCIEFYPYSYEQKYGISCSIHALMLVNSRPSLFSLVGDEALGFAKRAFAQFMSQ